MGNQSLWIVVFMFMVVSASSSDEGFDDFWKTNIERIVDDQIKLKDDMRRKDQEIQDLRNQIEANSESISTNGNAIAKHTTDIGKNKVNIEANDAEISNNAANIATYILRIATNKVAIEANDAQIQNNAESIAYDAGFNKGEIEASNSEIRRNY